MNTSILTDNQLAELRKALPHGSIKKIADALDITYETVSRVLNGHKSNTPFYEPIISEAISLVENIAESRNQLSERFEQLKNKAS